MKSKRCMVESRELMIFSCFKAIINNSFKTSIIFNVIMCLEGLQTTILITQTTQEALDLSNSNLLAQIFVTIYIYIQNIYHVRS